MKKFIYLLMPFILICIASCNMGVDSAYLKAVQEQIEEDIRMSEDQNLTFSVTYNGNGHTGGEVPVDETKYKEGDWINVREPGTMIKSGHSFVEWNTAENGSGESQISGSSFIMSTENVILYAQWETNGISIIVSRQENLSFSMYPSDFTLKTSGDTTKQIITAILDAGITTSSYQWFVNGEVRGTGNSLTLNTLTTPEWFELGVNDLTLFVVIDGVPYSEHFHFNVEQET